MAYSLYIDKHEEFNCSIQLEGASAQDASARLIIETGDWNLVFDGIIENNQCKIPLKKLKSVMNEGDTGRIRLEVIADDTLLKPWDDTYQALVSKKAVVEFNQPSISENKVKVAVNIQKPINEVDKLGNSFVNILTKNNIGIHNISENKKKVSKLLEKFTEKIQHSNIELNENEFIDIVIDKLTKKTK